MPANRCGTMDRDSFTIHTENIFTNDLKKRIELYSHFQEMTARYADLLSLTEYNNTQIHVDLAKCGNFLVFSPNSEGKAHLVGANFCRKRCCPMCMWRKSERQFANCLKIAEILTPQGYRFLHLVLTVPNCPDGGKTLTEAVRLLYSSFSRFYRYADVKRAFKGVLRCLEVSYNYEKHTFHPHLHCLVAVKKSYFNDSRVYLSIDLLRKLWKKATRSERDLQVYVRAIKEDDKMGFAEVSKYCVKPLDLEQGNETENAYILSALVYTLKGCRFTQTYGVIKEAMAQAKASDEAEPADIEEISKSERMFAFRYDWRVHQYVSVDF